MHFKCWLTGKEYYQIIKEYKKEFYGNLSILSHNVD